MPYAVDLIVRAMPQAVQARYASLGLEDRGYFKQRLRRFLERKPTHSISVRLWELFLHQEWPQEYADNGTPDLPLCCLPFSKDWYRVMQARVKRREETWRPGDVDARALEYFGFDVERKDNGSTRITRFKVQAQHKRTKGLCRKAEGRIGNRRDRACDGTDDGRDAA